MPRPIAVHVLLTGLDGETGTSAPADGRSPFCLPPELAESAIILLIAALA